MLIGSHVAHLSEVAPDGTVIATAMITSLKEEALLKLLDPFLLPTGSYCSFVSHQVVNLLSVHILNVSLTLMIRCLEKERCTSRVRLLLLTVFISGVWTLLGV